MRLIFIVNDYAGNGKGKRIWHKLNERLTIDFEVYFSQQLRHSEQLAREIAQRNEWSCLIVIGGDGTIHEVVNGVVGTRHIAVGVVPAGSGNDFARHYPVLSTAQEIELFLAKQQVSEQDCGVIRQQQGSQYFVNNSGIGFDAFVAEKANRSQLKQKLNLIRLGRLSYIYFVIQGLFQFQPFDLDVCIDGQWRRYKKVWFATVSNQPYFGGGMKLSPRSNTADGLLELTVVSKLSRWKFLSVFGTVFFGKHIYFREVEQVTGKCFALKLARLVPCHTDGEAFELLDTSQTIFIEVQERAWQVTKNIR